MNTFVINQSMYLNGEIEISGSKNAALPIICASLLTSDELILTNIPNIKDVHQLIKLLREIGVKIKFKDGKAICNSSAVFSTSNPSNLAKDIRASILMLGPLTARLGHAVLSLPGGCSIGARPIDQHLKGLEAMGAQIVVEHDCIKAQAISLQGAHIIMDVATVTGTENLLMAAVLAHGTTVLENAAREPEVVDLCNCLIKMGAVIEGVGSSILTINGVESLHGTKYSIMADRIEASTFAIAAVITRGDLTLNNVNSDSMNNVIKKLRVAGACIFERANTIRVFMDTRPKPVDIITLPYPGFPTDLQAPMTILNCFANGRSYVTESVYENRFQHISELQRMGAKIEIFGNTANVYGVPKLRGTKVAATDLRACASLVLAGLCAEGQTIVNKVSYLDRGYECMEYKLNKAGGKIIRI